MNCFVCFFLQGPRGAPGEAGPPGENGADVSWNYHLHYLSLLLVVGNRLSRKIMVAPWLGKTAPVESSVLSGSAIRSLDNSLFPGGCGGWIHGLTFLWLLPGCLLPSSCWLHSSSPLSISSQTARRHPLRSPTSSCEFQVTLAGLETHWTAHLAANWAMSCYQLAFHVILWYSTVLHLVRMSQSSQSTLSLLPLYDYIQTR